MTLEQGVTVVAGRCEAPETEVKTLFHGAIYAAAHDEGHEFPIPTLRLRGINGYGQRRREDIEVILTPDQALKLAEALIGLARLEATGAQPPQG
jgi:hypothetical protein